MEEREATVLRGEVEMSPSDLCRICYGFRGYNCVHCEEDSTGSSTEYTQDYLFDDCRACSGEGKHICPRCGGRGRTHQLFDELELLRDVNLDGYRLQVWDTNEMFNDGPQDKLAYRLTSPQGIVIFEGADFGNSPLNSIDGDEMIRSIIGFLTLQPGDTDEDYFYRYNGAQWEFAQGPAEELSIWGLEPNHLPGCKRSETELWECAPDCSMREYVIPNWPAEDEGEVVPSDPS